MKLSATGKRRLLKLAAFLDELPRRKFDFGFFGNPACGTAGCAIGYCPIAFPRFWKVVDETPVTRNCPYSGAGRGAAKFFGLSQNDVDYLFYPELRDAVKMCPLLRTATPKAVAKHIRSFIAEKESNV
jgi:hypothetical protein